MPKNPSSSRVLLSKNKSSEICRDRISRPKKLQKAPSMAEEKIEVIEIDDSYPSPDEKFTPLRPVLCLKSKDQIKKAEEREECFILEFDPYDDLEKLKFPLCNDFSSDEDDLRILAEKGQVACRDYPHPRHTCAQYPFDTTPHDSHCKLCYCYICDLSAPCSKWVGTYGSHCHAFNNEAWNQEKRRRQDMRL